MSITMVTANGIEHGLINTLANSVPFDDFKHAKPEDKEKFRKQQKEDNRLIKAKYIKYKDQEDAFERPYCKYAGDPIKLYKFLHGEVYDVPKGLVDEVNDISKLAPKRSGLNSEDGKELAKDMRGERVHEFFIIG